MKERKPLVWLQDKRESLKLTQAQAADKAGVQRTTYASVEQGYRSPSVNTAMKIAEAMDVEWTIFFDDKLHNMRNKEEVS